VAPPTSIHLQILLPGATACPGVALVAALMGATIVTPMARLVMASASAGLAPTTIFTLCQVCLKIGHTVATCWYRFDKEYVPEPRTAAAITTSSGSDNNWYTDSGATDHITGELDKLTMHDAYNGTDQIHVGNEAGMEISHVGTSIIPTHSRNLALNNVFHDPTSSKNLISVHKFTFDHNLIIEFHPFYFLIKDRKTRKVLLHGTCKGDLYPLPPPTSKFRKLIFHAIRISLDHWHNRLGHLAHDIVLHIIRDNNLPCASLDHVATAICDSCLCAKARQLPYSVSTSRAPPPLELIHSDVWGHAIQSFGHKKYYVSFIDDYRKFTWIYLLRHKSEVFQYFLEFQALVECMFNRKIITVQSDWGGGGG
jgi:hypothetical protein